VFPPVVHIIEMANAMFVYESEREREKKKLLCFLLYVHFY